MESKVKYALAIKIYVQNVSDVTKVKKQMEFLENETRRMLAQLEMTKMTFRKTEKRVLESAAGFNLEHRLEN